MLHRTNWVPGDPLYGRHPHSQYVFNFRDDAATEVCLCNDAATWPVPRRHHDLDNTTMQNAVDYEWRTLVTSTSDEGLLSGD